MPDQERDDAAFAAWWARFVETYPLATAEPKIKAAALLAWHAALAHCQSDDRWIAGYEAGYDAARAEAKTW